MADKFVWSACAYHVYINGHLPLAEVAKSRDRWSTECLIAAGTTGYSPIDTSGPRRSSYVHKLREFGVPIATITKQHDGPFAGAHARYVLRTTVRCLSDRKEAA